MKYVLGVVVLVVLLFLGIVAQGQTASCQGQFQAATAMIDEYQEQIRVMSGRAAAYYGRMQGLSVKLKAAQAKIAQLQKEIK